MRSSQNIFVTALGAALVLLVAHGAQARADFSADTSMTNASGQTVSARMVVSKGRVRLEYELKGQPVVQINDPANQKIWMLFPLRKQFTVRDAPPGALAASLGGQASRNPCDAIPGAVCTDLGNEQLNGRSARKWNIQMSRQGRTMTMTQWIDATRGFPLRQDFGGGNRAELVMLGNDEVDGRAVEKWELIMHRGDSDRVDQQWYDPELGTTIRERKHDGSVRMLSNIQVGPQDPSLFQIPGGYRQLDSDGGRF